MSADPTARIISHMNADHQDSVRRYLEHRFGLHSFATRNARLTSINLSTLQISTIPSPAKPTLDNTYTIVLDPPLQSYADARQRLIKLDFEAMAALGRSPITIKTYKPPRGFHLVLFVTCLSTFILLFRRANLDPVTAPPWISRTFIARFPKAFEFFWKVQPYVFWIMAVVHLGEMTWMIRSRLAKHSVPVGSKVWLLWAVDTFIEGFGCFERFDALVKAEHRKLDAKKH